VRFFFLLFFSFSTFKGKTRLKVVEQDCVPSQEYRFKKYLPSPIPLKKLSIFPSISFLFPHRRKNCSISDLSQQSKRRSLRKQVLLAGGNHSQFWKIVLVRKNGEEKCSSFHRCSIRSFAIFNHIRASFNTSLVFFFFPISRKAFPLFSSLF